MANDIEPDWRRSKQRVDPRFQQMLRELPLSAFDKIERFPDPSRGITRIFGYYDNFTATHELDPEPMVLHPMFEDWYHAQSPEDAPTPVPAPVPIVDAGAEADWQTPAWAIAGDWGVDPAPMKHMNQFDAALYLQSNDPANLAPDIDGWADHVGYPQTGGKPPAGTDAGTGSRRPRPGEDQVAFAQVAPAALYMEPLIAAAIAALLRDEAPDILSELPPETAAKLFGTNPAIIGKFILDRFGAGDDKGSRQQRFDMIDRPLPDRTEFPAEGIALPDRTEFPADPPHLPDRLENPIHESQSPEPETFPDTSGEFDGFDVVETKELPRPNDLSAGDLPAGTTRDETARLPPGLRELVEEHFLGGGVETFAGKDGSTIEGDHPAAEGERTFEQMVKALGGDPSRIRAKPMKDGGGTVRRFKNTKEGYTIVWRTKSSLRSGGQPTLEVQRFPPAPQKGSTYYRYKKRYNP